MNSIIESGFLRIELEVSIIGPLGKDEAQKTQHELLAFFKKRKLNVSGKIKHIRVSTFEFEKSHVDLDTSSK